MNLGNLAKRVTQLASDNSPTILTALAVTGTMTTAYLTGKASFKAADVLAELDQVWRLEGPPPLKDKVNATWKLYIPAASVLASTVVCVIMANRIGTRRTAAIAAAYTTIEKAAVEYREKVVEKLGEEKEKEVREELAQERVNNTPGGREVIISGPDEVLCFEEFSARYFKSSVEKLNRAMNEINHQLNTTVYASLSDFYNKIGLAETSQSQEIGWNSDRLMELRFSTVMSEDDRPCISVDYDVAPVRDYMRFH